MQSSIFLLLLLFTYKCGEYNILVHGQLYWLLPVFHENIKSISQQKDNLLKK